jgi:hypothetical protein
MTSQNPAPGQTGGQGPASGSKTKIALGVLAGGAAAVRWLVREHHRSTARFQASQDRAAVLEAEEAFLREAAAAGMTPRDYAHAQAAARTTANQAAADAAKAGMHRDVSTGPLSAQPPTSTRWAFVDGHWTQIDEDNPPPLGR